MVVKKISPKIQLAAEKYLASLGSSKEQLTDKQWEVVANYVRVQRKTKAAGIALLIYGIIFACLGFWLFRIGEKAIDSVLPSDTKETVFISASGEKSSPVEPDYIRNCIKRLTRLHETIGAVFAFTIFSFAGVLSYILQSREKRKMLEAFIPRAGETKITSSEDK